LEFAAKAAAARVGTSDVLFECEPPKVRDSTVHDPALPAERIDPRVEAALRD
jgi:hypothetical protein